VTLPIDTLLVSHSPGECRVAGLVAGRVEWLAVERSWFGLRAGSVHRGRVLAALKGAGAYLLDIADRRPALLRAADTAGTPLAEGAAVTVEVVRTSYGEKGARVKARREPWPGEADRAAPALLDAGPELATAAYGQWRGDALKRIVTDTRAAANALTQIAARGGESGKFDIEFGGADAFERDGGEEALAQALSPRIALAGGAWISIEATEALSAIDVNSGGRAESGGEVMTARAINLEAAVEIARALRLRDIAGAVLIDFVGEPRRGRGDPVLGRLRAALAQDPSAVQLFGRTALGLVELSRRRRGVPLAALMLEPGAARPSASTIALAAFRAAVREVARRPRREIVLAAAPEAIAAAQDLGAARRELEAAIAPTKLALRPMPIWPRERFEVFAP
jgi:ribonuclease G